MSKIASAAFLSVISNSNLAFWQRYSILILIPCAFREKLIFQGKVIAGCYFYAGRYNALDSGGQKREMKVDIDPLQLLEGKIEEKAAE